MRQIPLLHSSRTFRCMAAFILPGKEQMQIRKIPMSLYKLESAGSFRDVLHRDLFSFRAKKGAVRFQNLKIRC